MRCDMRPDRGQLPHVLCAHGTGIPQGVGQAGMALGTDVGMMVSHRIDMVRIGRWTIMFGMPWLPAFGAPTRRARWAWWRRGRIGRGRFGRVLGMLVEPRFEIGQALTESGVLLLELHDHLLVLGQNGEQGAHDLTNRWRRGSPVCRSNPWWWLALHAASMPGFGMLVKRRRFRWSRSDFVNGYSNLLPRQAERAYHQNCADCGCEWAHRVLERDLCRESA